MNKKHIDQEVEKTLDSLAGIERAETKPFFYTRLTSKLHPEPVLSSGFRWQWTVAVVAILITLNGYAYLNFWPSTTEEEEIEWLAEEYTLDYLDLYDQELEP